MQKGNRKMQKSECRSKHSDRPDFPNSAFFLLISAFGVFPATCGLVSRPSTCAEVGYLLGGLENRFRRLPYGRSGLLREILNVLARPTYT